MEIRLQRFLADGGIASRRASERLISTGRVSVNGRLVSRLGTRIDPGRDRVECDGRLVRPQRKQYVLLHKPRGYLCTRRDPSQRPTVGGLLPREWDHVVPVGRLDFASEGLLLMTNDGQLAFRLTHPRFGVLKTYVATAAGRVTPEMLRPMARGLLHEGECLQAKATRLMTVSNAQSVVEVKLAEGKNREVRRLFECCGLRILRLVRTQIGPLRLDGLPCGKWRLLNPAEVRRLNQASRPPATAPPIGANPEN